MAGDQIILVVYWCLATVSVDTFNPHRTNAVERFVTEHPNECKATPSDFIQEPNVTVEVCRRRSMLAFMPGWLQKPENAGKVYLGADCELYPSERGEKLDLQALKDRVKP